MQRSYLSLLAVVVLGLAGCSTEEPAEDDTATEAPTSPSPTDDAPTDAVDEPTETETDATPDETDGEEPAGGDEADSEPTGDTDAGGQSDASVEDLEFTTCESDDITVDYPGSWNVHENADVPPCRVFHPQPIEDFVGESQHYAARLYIDPVEFEDAAGSSGGEELSRRETTVDGRDAVVIEAQSSGEAMLAEGERSYTYIVDLDGMILVGTTTSVGDTDYERDKQVLDRMMETLTVDLTDA